MFEVEWPGKDSSHVALRQKSIQAQETSRAWPQNLECAWGRRMAIKPKSLLKGGMEGIQGQDGGMIRVGR